MCDELANIEMLKANELKSIGKFAFFGVVGFGIGGLGFGDDLK
jgi:hypothetical protein